MTAARAIGATSTCWSPAPSATAAADAAAQLAGVRKVLLAEAPHLANQLAEELAGADRAADGRLRRARRAGDRARQERPAARRRAARRGADLRHRRGRRRPTPSSGRSTPATRWQPCKSPDAKKVITVRTAAFPAAPADGGLGRRSRPSPRPQPVGISRSRRPRSPKLERPELTGGARRRLGRPRHGVGRELQG